MDVSFLSTIAINLGAMLVATWVIGFLIFRKLIQDRNKLEKAVQNLRKKESKSKKPPPQKKDYPLSPIYDASKPSTSTDEIEAIFSAVDTLKEDNSKKASKIAHLNKLHSQQKNNFEQLDNTEGLEDLVESHEQSLDIINQLEDDLTESQTKIAALESQLKNNIDKDGRISILEKNEERLQNRVSQLNEQQDHVNRLADSLKNANEKNQKLRKENQQLHVNIKKMAYASDEQLALIRKISKELDKASQLEQYQQRMIDDLTEKLKQEKIHDEDSESVKQLENQLKDTQEVLQRTLIEKDFIESHLIEMDKSLEKSKETELALEQAQKKLQSVEKNYPDFTEQKHPDIHTSSNDSEEKKPPLPRLEITKDNNPELFSAIEDNRLFGITQEFWMTLDAPPLKIESDNNIYVPNNLDNWIKTDVSKEGLSIYIGTNDVSANIISKAMFGNNAQSNKKDALGELGNIIAGNFANELNPEYTVGIPSHLSKNDFIEETDKLAVATEVLLTANKEPVYLALAQQST